ncbi:hypothetical protein B0A58_00750 [Flavobacterium branchiophilum NBRC 15030 = ATCC 35035]|uniref:FCP1 homology domain-containing protein n=1 Tax=Flavobacterium branchiophilum TaxID=55197 RepID=A0A543FZJ0_9FLAO|nr:HAD domain-containing protein [Flavobacterium branchiophilum]OXA81986.1 hypothetical protein B0A58_00750 [Flavobacterium branchiophilum NBRC 15030 = ATCC 35035]TQM39253.1 hypothetical protein BC670_0027 [Flavobacterium branchiophilum]GEM54113.1 hypothetical protein FB1_03340 [Flavobacterium branchiophilum NBRC 15030 = ATCC 35035]
MLILLDIDGVMVTGNSWKRPEFLADGFPAFSNRASSALQKLISETSADIMLTTSHKSNYSIEEWSNIFNLRGIKIKNIYRLPENKTFLSRKEEIMNWVNTSNELPNFVIIDDDKSLNGLPIFVKNKLIQTNASIGLTTDLINEALEHIAQEQHTNA